MCGRPFNMPILEQNVTFPGETTLSLSGFLARPEGAGPFPGVVVIHEAYGLNDNIQNVARRFANEGYAALSADLFAGRNTAVCMARFIGGRLFKSLDNSRITD